MTKQDLLEIRNQVVDFDEVIKVLRGIPTSLVLVVRNLNIVRSLNRDLGCPVNRYNIMARRCVAMVMLGIFTLYTCCIVPLEAVEPLDTGL